MIVLGISTSTEQVGVALGGQEGVIASFTTARGRRHAETLVPALEFLCQSARFTLDDVSVVAVDIGPGLFTGLRVGLSAAKATAQALRVPMIGISSLDLLAFAVRQSPRRIVAMVDARRGEVFTASYRHVPGGVQRLSEPRAVSPATLADELATTPEECLLVGDGAVRYAAEFAGDSRLEQAGAGVAHPSPSALVDLAHPRALREEFVTPGEIQALYLRGSDAERNLRPGP